MKTKLDIPFQNWIKDESFTIHPLSQEVQEATYRLGAHIHHYHEILFVQEGEGSMMIDEKTYYLKQQTIYCIWQGQVHKWLEGRNRKGFAIMFKNDFLPSMDTETIMLFNATLFNRLQKVNDLALDAAEAAYYHWMFSHLLAEFNEPAHTFGQKQTTQHLMMTLLVKLARKTVEYTMGNLHKPKTEAEIFQTFLLLLEHNYQVNTQLKFYAQQLGTNSRKLNDIVKTHAGKTVKQVVQERILLEAKRLLAHTASPQKEIAYKLGFNNQAYFCYFFKKEVGTSPMDYRKAKR